jgi:hypothetical protein
MAKLTFEVIGTGAKVDVGGWLSAYGDYVDEAASNAEGLFNQSLSGFKRHTPVVEKRGTAKKNSRGDIEIIVGVLRPSPDNQIYSHVNWGTKARVLTAHNPRGMRFKVWYRPATRHGSLSGGTWTKVGPWTVRYTINHPGTTARRFDEFIHKALTGNNQTEARKVLSNRKGKFWRKT